MVITGKNSSAASPQGFTPFLQSIIMETMKYIVLDLEWNQCPKGKQKENPRLPFEIIEIGAVKLNSDREPVDEFHGLVRPQVYHWIHSHTREIIHMDYSSLVNGLPFPDLVFRFLKWCGEDYGFCTWGNQDLLELQRNLKYYDMEDLLLGPVKYYDIQKLFNLQYERGQAERRSLEYAVDYLNIRKNETFHRALADARYTAKILGAIDKECVHRNFSIDVYQNPKSKKEEIHIFYDNYEKYISREFPSKEAATGDREVNSTRCPLCHRAAKKKVRWFSVNSRNYFSVSICPEHGYVRGKVRMKKTEEGKFYAVKTVSLISADDAEKILEKKEFLCAKRRLHRHSAQ